jgi:nicotinate-nucleotide pyrophosphorylase (carboxylating)
MVAPLSDLVVEPIVRAALAEDLGRAGDITSAACIDADATLSAAFRNRTRGVVAGLACARLAIRALDPDAVFDAEAQDGDLVEPSILALVKGKARALLSAERVALNFMSRLSGIATLTRAYVEAVAGTGAVITDTRKTTPGLRAFEKYAVACGGGVNHRFGLDDAILIKDNHVAISGGGGDNASVGAAIKRARAAVGHLVKVEAEVDSLSQLEEALAERPDVVMLDNFSLEELKAAVSMAKGKVTLEASGGVTLETVRAIAETGVDVISVGALTHSAPILDIGLDAL